MGHTWCAVGGGHRASPHKRGYIIFTFPTQIVRMFRPSGALLRVVRVSLSRLSSSSSTTSLRSLLSTRPLLTNCITYGLLYSGSDLIQQTLMKKVLADTPEEFDFGGIFRYWVVGTFQFP